MPTTVPQQTYCAAVRVRGERLQARGRAAVEGGWYTFG